MPLNKTKVYTYTPVSSGETKVITKVSTRSRLYIGGTYFRSKERGQQANMIKIDLDENRSRRVGDVIIHNDVINQTEMLISSDDIKLEIYDSKLNWYEEIRVFGKGSAISSVEFISISRRLSVGGTIATYGPYKIGSVIRLPNITFSMQGSLTEGLPTVIKPRFKKYPLSWIAKTVETDGGVPSTTYGWSIEGLRALINADPEAWVYMPRRNTAVGALDAEDIQDEGIDSLLLESFSSTPMAGGDGLPTYPTGLHTGPDRTLIHLNYSEKDDGSLGVVNQILEWNGSSGTNGFWDIYY